MIDIAKKTKIVMQELGYDSIEEMLQTLTFDSVSPGICKNANCDYLEFEMEPDASHWLCEVCNTNSVDSILSLLELV